MQQIFNQVGQIAQQLASIIWRVLQFIWNWSFGQVGRMFNHSFTTLDIWKQIVFVLVIGALVYFLYKVFKDLLGAVQSILKAIVGLISSLIGMLPQIVIAGLIAFGGAWIVNQPTPSWMPGILVKGGSPK
ncbi:MAG TPA: hypothetical protein VFZ16_09250 [Hyphomicrobiaceae bacterium]|nr:hypothetical protein [Hyphomicrobiaceae bacterium]